MHLFQIKLTATYIIYILKLSQGQYNIRITLFINILPNYIYVSANRHKQRWGSNYRRTSGMVLKRRTDPTVA